MKDTDDHAGLTPVSTLTRTDHTPQGQVKAIILALHGMNDYRTAFDHLGAFMVTRGVRVVAVDQRGFGENRDWGRWAGTDRLAQDAIDLIDQLHANNPGVPLYLLGGSMGASVAIIAKARAPDMPVDGVVLSGPAVWGGDAMNPLIRASLWLVRKLAPGWKLTGHRLGKQASDNIEAIRKLGRDPLVIKQTRIDAVGGLVDLMTEARALLPKIQGRFFVPRGARDEIIPSKSQADVAKMLAAQDCVTALYPDGWHMLMRDHQREVLFADILAWIQDDDPLPSGHAFRCAPPASGAEQVERDGVSASLSSSSQRWISY